MAQHASRARHTPTARANTAYPQKLEHLLPVLVGQNVSGRQRQPLTLPRGVQNAAGGMVVEAQRDEIRVVQDAGDEVACGSARDFDIRL